MQGRFATFSTVAPDYSRVADQFAAFSMAAPDYSRVADQFAAFSTAAPDYSRVADQFAAFSTAAPDYSRVADQLPRIAPCTSHLGMSEREYPLILRKPAYRHPEFPSVRHRRSLPAYGYCRRYP